MIGDQPGSIIRSGARGEFGALVPVRPGAGKRAVCLRGHRLDLDLYDQLAPYSHRYKAARHTVRGLPRARKVSILLNAASPNGPSWTSRPSSPRVQRPAMAWSWSSISRPPGHSAAGSSFGSTGVRLPLRLPRFVAPAGLRPSTTSTSPLSTAASATGAHSLRPRLLVPRHTGGPLHYPAVRSPSRSELASRCAAPGRRAFTPALGISGSEGQRSRREAAVEQVLQEVWQLGWEEFVAALRDGGSRPPTALDETCPLIGRVPDGDPR